jgi:hypothetical protein
VLIPSLLLGLSYIAEYIGANIYYLLLLIILIVLLIVWKYMQILRAENRNKVMKVFPVLAERKVYLSEDIADYAPNDSIELIEVEKSLNHPLNDSKDDKTEAVIINQLKENNIGTETGHIYVMKSDEGLEKTDKSRDEKDVINSHANVEVKVTEEKAFEASESDSDYSIGTISDAEKEEELKADDKDSLASESDSDHSTGSLGDTESKEELKTDGKDSLVAASERNSEDSEDISDVSESEESSSDEEL